MQWAVIYLGEKKLHIREKIEKSVTSSQDTSKECPFFMTATLSQMQKLVSEGCCVLLPLVELVISCVFTYILCKQQCCNKVLNKYLHPQADLKVKVIAKTETGIMIKQRIDCKVYTGHCFQSFPEPHSIEHYEERTVHSLPPSEERCNFCLWTLQAFLFTLWNFQ